MWGKTLKQDTKEFQTLCSLYFSVVKNKLYLHLGGGGVWRALCEGGAGGTFPLLLSPPPPPRLGQKEMAAYRGRVPIQLLSRIPGVDCLTTPYQVGNKPGEVFLPRIMLSLNGKDLNLT